MTQKELSIKAGLAEITIREYENNKYSPKFEQLQKLATALECSVYDFYEPERVASLMAVEALYGTKKRLEKIAPVLLDAMAANIAWRENKDRFIDNCNEVFKDFTEMMDCLDTFKDLTRDEVIQIWDFAKWVKTKRVKEGESNAE